MQALRCSSCDCLRGSGRRLSEPKSVYGDEDLKERRKTCDACVAAGHDEHKLVSQFGGVALETIVELFEVPILCKLIDDFNKLSAV